ncbi:hypothetical protein BCV71DRAFT_269303 [Rhizopus microsporus]|uniref:Uncharacterized protein n=1 Tax=Rhizopus microsporus TaxID=58291 RepID=A0A1X0RJZ7_RHIZD|nr:hypothetical protein BCV71DRAFT_269303 [Rhizopus microsporus]
MYKGNWKTLSSVSFEADKGYPNGKSRGRLFTQIGQVEYSSPILPPDRSFHKKVKQSSFEAFALQSCSTHRQGVNAAKIRGRRQNNFQLDMEVGGVLAP